MPSDEALQAAVDKAYAEFKDVKEGANADYIPILATVPSDLFGVVIVTNEGKVFQAGDVDYRFSIQSVSKPFTAALIMAQQSPKVVREKIGVEPTGMVFNSKVAVELYEARSVNPMVNAGAIAAVSLVEADSEKQRWEIILDNIEGFAVLGFFPADTGQPDVRRKIRQSPIKRLQLNLPRKLFVSRFLVDRRDAAHDRVATLRGHLW